MCLSCHLDRLKSGTALTPSHHYPLWSILGVFITFAIEILAHTSPQMVLSSHSMVFVSSPRQWCFVFLPTSNMLMWSFGRIRVKHTCIAYIAKSNNGSWRKISYTQIKVCMCVEMGWSWLLHSNDSFSIFYMRARLVFFCSTMDQNVSSHFFHGPSCVHFFLFFSIL